MSCAKAVLLDVNQVASVFASKSHYKSQQAKSFAKIFIKLLNENLEDGDEIPLNEFQSSPSKNRVYYLSKHNGDLCVYLRSIDHNEDTEKECATARSTIYDR